MKPTKPGLEDSQEPIHKIRITLSSKNVKNLEKGLFSFSLVYVFVLLDQIWSILACISYRITVFFIEIRVDKIHFLLYSSYCPK